MKRISSPSIGFLDTRYVLDSDRWLVPPADDFFDPTGGLPTDPDVGDRYVSDATAGGWTIDYIYEWDGDEWIESPPELGWMIWVLLELLFYVFTINGWVEVGEESFVNITGDTMTGDLEFTGAGVGIDADKIKYTPGETVAHIFDETLNSGLMHDCTLVDVGGLGITWPASEMWDDPNNTEVETDAGSGTCTDNTINFLIWVTGSTLTLGTTKADVSAGEIDVAEISCQDGDIWHIDQADRIRIRTYELSEAVGEMFPTIITDGLILTEDTDVTNAFDVALSTGTYYHNGHQRNTISPQVLSRTVPMVRWYKVAGVWTSDTNAEIDETQWNDPAKGGGQGLVNINSAKYYRSCWFLVGSIIHWVYPDVQYNTIGQALEGIDPIFPPGLIHHPRLMCVVLKGNDVAFPTAGGERWVDERPIIGSSIRSSTSDHGNLAGLGDDDHTQYTKKATLTTKGDIYVATGTSTPARTIVFC